MWSAPSDDSQPCGVRIAPPRSSEARRSHRSAGLENSQRSSSLHSTFSRQAWPTREARAAETVAWSHGGLAPELPESPPKTAITLSTEDSITSVAVCACRALGTAPTVSNSDCAAHRPLVRRTNRMCNNKRRAANPAVLGGLVEHQPFRHFTSLQPAKHQHLVRSQRALSCSRRVPEDESTRGGHVEQLAPAAAHAAVAAHARLGREVVEPSRRASTTRDSARVLQRVRHRAAAAGDTAGGAGYALVLCGRADSAGAAWTSDGACVSGVAQADTRQGLRGCTRRLQWQHL